MPHSSSAKKSVRKIEKRRVRNRTAKRDIKVQVKKFLAIEKTGSIEDAQKEFKATVKKLDKASAKRVMHKNTAARKKSQLARMMNTKTAAAKTKPS